MFDTKIRQKIQDLERHGAIGLKASFEDEGVSDSELIDLLLLTKESGLQNYVKIGGCEANRDIDTCLRLGIVGVVAPMVESVFAVKKFIASVNSRSDELNIPSPKKYVNIETFTAVHCVDQIVEHFHHELDGIVVGRSDLSRSLSLTKKNVNDDVVTAYVIKAMEVAKEKGLTTKMGGSISKESVPVITRLFELGLLDRFETRAVIFSVKDCIDVEKSIVCALEYEQLLMHKRGQFYKVKEEAFFEREKIIGGRK